MHIVTPPCLLAVTADALRDIDGRDALNGLATLFSKCKHSLDQGERLENISWRLWHTQRLLSKVSAAKNRPEGPLTPESTVDGESSRNYFSPSHKVPRIPVPNLPPHRSSPTPLSPFSSCSNGSEASSTQLSLSAPSLPVSASDAAHLTAPCRSVGDIIYAFMSPTVPFPYPSSKQSKSSQTVTDTNSMAAAWNEYGYCALLTPSTDSDSQHSSDVAIPTVTVPTELSDSHSITPTAVGSTSEASSGPPRVVVVNPTPNPTPHPTPPATPHPGSRPSLAPPSSLTAQGRSATLSPPLASGSSFTSQPLQGSPEALSDITSSTSTDENLPLRSSKFTLDRQHSTDSSSSSSMSPANAGHRRNVMAPSHMRASGLTTRMANTKRPSIGDIEVYRSNAGSPVSKKAAPQVTRDDTKGKSNVVRRPAFDIGSVSSDSRSNGGSSSSGQQESPVPSLDKGKGKEKCQGSPNALSSQNTRKTREHANNSPGREGSGRKVAIQSNPPKPSQQSSSSRAPINSLEAAEKALVPRDGRPRMQLALASEESESYESDDDDDDDDDSGSWVSEDDESDEESQVVTTVPSRSTSHNKQQNHARFAEPVLSAKHRKRNTFDGAATAAQAAEIQRRLHEAAVEAQRQREMFEKKPARTYSKNAEIARNTSGLLTMLMNPRPEMFPPGHPERVKSMERLERLERMKRNKSSGDIGFNNVLPSNQPGPSRMGRGHTLGGLTMTAMTNNAPTSPTASRPAPPLSISKSTAAVPETVSASVTAQASGSTESSRRPSDNGGYQRKGPPANMEMDDDSDDNPDDQIQLSQSLAQQRLATLAGKKPSATRQTGNSSRNLEFTQVDVSSTPNPVLSGSGSDSASHRPAPVENHTAPTPIPQFPYNLPTPAPPSTPRTTRRLMLRTEMSESLRQNLLWSRQLSTQELAGPKPRRSKSGTGIDQRARPLPTVKSLVHLTPKQPRKNQGSSQERSEREAAEREELMRDRELLTRANPWSSAYHTSGW